jgi:hypothetical protein
MINLKTSSRTLAACWLWQCVVHTCLIYEQDYCFTPISHAIPHLKVTVFLEAVLRHFSQIFPHMGQPLNNLSSTNELQPLAIWVTASKMHLINPQQCERQSNDMVHIYDVVHHFQGPLLTHECYFQNFWLKSTQKYRRIFNQMIIILNIQAHCHFMLYDFCEMPSHNPLFPSQIYVIRIRLKFKWLVFRVVNKSSFRLGILLK